MAIDALYERLRFLWNTTEIDAGYRQALQSVLAHLLKPAANERGREKGEGPLLLPDLCCHSLRGESQAGLSVNAAWTLLYAAFYLLDKVEDKETIEPLSSRLTTSTLLNATTGLILAAELLLAELAETLADMGMPLAFSTSEADFSGIAEIPPALYISHVLHKAYVVVDEVGTEAAAATAVEFGRHRHLSSKVTAAFIDATKQLR